MAMRETEVYKAKKCSMIPQKQQRGISRPFAFLPPDGHLFVAAGALDVIPFRYPGLTKARLVVDLHSG